MKPFVMFVDDDPMLLAGMRRQLIRKLTAFDFVFCQGGQAALDEAAVRTPDILFSDVRMPEMDGPTFLAIYKEKYPQTACYALSGQTDDKDLIRLMALVDHVFLKPIDSQQIHDLIMQHVEPESHGDH